MSPISISAVDYVRLLYKCLHIWPRKLKKYIFITGETQDYGDIFYEATVFYNLDGCLLIVLSSVIKHFMLDSSVNTAMSRVVMSTVNSKDRRICKPYFIHYLTIRWSVFASPGPTHNKRKRSTFPLYLIQEQYGITLQNNFDFLKKC